jgi:hypothetical protein
MTIDVDSDKFTVTLSKDEVLWLNNDAKFQNKAYYTNIKVFDIPMCITIAYSSITSKINLCEEK